MALPDPIFLCSVCGGVLDDPMQTPCKHRFCFECILKFRKADRVSCPVCSKSFPLSLLARIDPKIFENELSHLLLRCENHSRGCGEILTLISLSQHVCDFTPVDCPYPNCTYTYGTPLKLNRRDLESHKATCEWRLQTCVFSCGEAVPANKSIAHASSCRRRPVHCPQLCGEPSIPFDKLEEHIQVCCPKTIILCDVGGCDFATAREFREVWNEHMVSTPNHTSAIVAQLRAKDEQINTLLEILNRERKETAAYRDSKDAEISSLQKLVKVIRIQMESRIKSLNQQLLEQATLMSRMQKLGLSSSRSDDSDVVSISGISNSPMAESVDFALTPPVKRRRNKGWSLLPEMSTRRHGCAAAWNGMDMIFVAGGFNEESPLASAEAFSFSTMRWSNLPDMPVARSWCASVFAVDCLFVVGGCDRSRICLDSVDMLDTRIGKWCTLPPMTSRREGCAAVMAGCRLIAIGGFDGVSYVNSVEMFDLSTLGWSPLPCMDMSRGACCAACVGDKVIVCGGSQGQVVLSSAAMLDLNTMKWTNLPPMARPRIGAACAFDSIGNCVIVVGGSDGKSYLSDAECFDMAAMVWYPLSVMSTTRMGCACVCAAGRLIILGGSESLPRKLASCEMIELI